MKRLLFLPVLAFFATASADGAPKPPEPLYETRAEHDPNGIGKFFMGREIAHVMGHQAAGWLERPEREQEERTDKLIELLGLKPGMHVADIGCGTGYIAERIAPRILPGGVVHGVDIQKEMLELLVKKMKMRRIANVEPVLGDVADPKLEPGSCDMMVMVDVYHEFEFPFEMVGRMAAGLKKGGQLVFIEYRGEDPDVPIKLVHKMTEAQVKREVALHPELEWVQTKEELPQQHIIFFRKK
ncbi:MAG: class I SAM-dependent methyltransferase [Chthoniobacteraceae bacterium]